MIKAVLGDQVGANLANNQAPGCAHEAAQGLYGADIEQTMSTSSEASCLAKSCNKVMNKVRFCPLLRKSLGLLCCSAAGGGPPAGPADNRAPGGETLEPWRPMGLGVG